MLSYRGRGQEARLLPVVPAGEHGHRESGGDLSFYDDIGESNQSALIFERKTMKASTMGKEIVMSVREGEMTTNFIEQQSPQTNNHCKQHRRAVKSKPQIKTIAHTFA
ncbi:hypothetical protein DdX_07875 [Ditylenchus destructor]|uniref:Uncharacterized protein n=1 Tax=Ditylenchus destructor TaxID=166010 RepID=A0AAD4R7P6_9BILA|nr:hypothetical protein DdX_07875 [Ditylenchus destructor]